MKSSTKTSTCVMGPLCFMSGTQSSGCDRGSASSVSSETGGDVCRVQSSGCGNGSARAEMGLVVGGLKGGSGPTLGCWGSPSSHEQMWCPQGSAAAQCSERGRHW